MKISTVKAKVLATVGAVVMLGGVGMAAAPVANASTYDFWPGSASGYYSSSEATPGSHAGFDAAPESGYGSSIEWTSNSIRVFGPVKDVKADGNGAIVEVLTCFGGGVPCFDDIAHVTKGNGNYVLFDKTHTGTVTDGSVVEIRACNGLSPVGNPENCGVYHGPFHNY